jgi:hypothetical protein
MSNIELLQAEDTIRELRAEIERLRVTLRIIADGQSHDPQLDALRALE